MEFEGTEEPIIIQRLRCHDIHNTFVSDIITSNIPTRLHLGVRVFNDKTLIKDLPSQLGTILALTSVNGNHGEFPKYFEELLYLVVAKHGRYYYAISDATTGGISLHLRPFPGTPGGDITSFEYNVVALFHI
jgi:hypothetical protein